MKNDNNSNKKEEGAVLLLVVLVLLVLTATAVYTVYATTAELQGAGATARAFQTEEMSKSLAEGTVDWVDRVGPASLYRQVYSRSSALDMSGAEYPATLATGQVGSRLYQQDLEALINSPVSYISNESMNNVYNHNIHGVIDVYDVYLFTGNVAGSRTDGYGSQKHFTATYTVRVRTQNAALESNTGINPLILNRHSTQSTSRVYATSGPFNL